MLCDISIPKEANSKQFDKLKKIESPGSDEYFLHIILNQ